MEASFGFSILEGKRDGDLNSNNKYLE